jgi:hypothetical protein
MLQSVLGEACGNEMVLLSTLSAYVAVAPSLEAVLA